MSRRRGRGGREPEKRASRRTPAPARPGHRAQRRDAAPKAPRARSRAQPAPFQLGPLRSHLTVAAALAVVAFAVFNANGREAYPTGDSRPTALLPFTLMYEGDLDLNEYHPPGAGISGPIRMENGRILSNYSPVPALLSLPLYLPVRAHRAEVDGDILRWTPFFSKLAGSFWAAIAVAAFYLAATRIATRRAAALTTIVLAFASPFWISGSQTLGQHGLTVLCGSLAFLGLAELKRSGLRRWALLAGFACALAVGIRLSNVVLFAAFLVYLALFARRFVLPFVIPVLLVAVPAVLQLLAIVGGAGGGLHSFAFLTRIFDQLGSPFGPGLVALLLSPGEGLLLWSPAVALMLLPVGSLLAEPPGARPRELRRLLVFSLAVFGAFVLLYAAYVEWWGGRTYGPRYVTDGLPFLLLPAAAALERWLPRRGFWAAFVAAVVVSAAIQALGAFRFPCAGDEPGRIRRDEYRIWDWSDTDVSFCWTSPRRPAQDFATARRLVRMMWSDATS